LHLLLEPKTKNIMIKPYLFILTPLQRSISRKNLKYFNTDPNIL
jgi:hypothetical protein